MKQVASANINSFGSSPDGDQVPTGDHVFILTAQELQGIINTATRDLISRLDYLERIVDIYIQPDPRAISNNLEDQPVIEAFKRQTKASRKFNGRITSLEERLDDIEDTKPLTTTNQRDQADILKALLAANCGKMLTSEARKKMRMAKSSFSVLLKRCDFIEVRKSELDSRKNLIILKSKFVHEP